MTLHALLLAQAFVQKAQTVSLASHRLAEGHVIMMNSEFCAQQETLIFYFPEKIVKSRSHKIIQEAMSDTLSKPFSLKCL